MGRGTLVVTSEYVAMSHTPPQVITSPPRRTEGAFPATTRAALFACPRCPLVYCHFPDNVCRHFTSDLVSPFCAQLLRLVPPPSQAQVLRRSIPHQAHSSARPL